METTSLTHNRSQDNIDESCRKRSCNAARTLPRILTTTFNPRLCFHQMHDCILRHDVGTDPRRRPLLVSREQDP
jgi:hypothetical protein